MHGSNFLKKRVKPKKSLLLHLDLKKDFRYMSQEEVKEQPVVSVEDAYNKTEQYVSDNKKSISFIVGGIVALVGIYLGWKYLYLQPRSDEAAAAMYKAELFFQKDSFNLAINGQGETLGFESIVDEYGMTPAGNLARYYLGVSYLRVGRYDEAIATLEEFNSDDQMMSTLSLGLLGDAHLEKGSTDEALSYYMKAAKTNANKFTSPIFLKKEAFVHEDLGHKEEALQLYQQIRSEYPESQEAQQVDKYIARLGGEVK
jgi:TolA-binding protein